MRHRKRGRVLGRSPSHRKAMLKNLACALFLTEREIDEELEPNPPKVKGRIITTLPKAKEVRPLVEKCITIARRSLQHQRNAEQFATDAERGSEAWKAWRDSEQWQQWCHAISPAVAARRRVLQMLGDKLAVQILFEEIAPRFEDREGGYTRVLKLAKPRLGDAGERAILELVGTHDRVKAKSERPAFDLDDEPVEEETDEMAIGGEAATDDGPDDGQAVKDAQSEGQEGGGDAAASDAADQGENAQD